MLFYGYRKPFKLEDNITTIIGHVSSSNFFAFVCLCSERKRGKCTYPPLRWQWGRKEWQSINTSCYYLPIFNLITHAFRLRLCVLVWVRSISVKIQNIFFLLNLFVDNFYSVLYLLGVVMVIVVLLLLLSSSTSLSMDGICQTTMLNDTNWIRIVLLKTFIMRMTSYQKLYKRIDNSRKRPENTSTVNALEFVSA